MTAYNNQEDFPKQRPVLDVRTQIDSVIKGTGNIVERSARNVVVNGDRNYIGEETKNINIFNCSGCTVSSGVIGVTLINSSGVIARTDNLVYINNQEYKFGDTVENSSYNVVTTTTFMDTSMGTIEQKAATTQEVYLPLALGHNQKFTIKNNTAFDQDVKPADGSVNTIDFAYIWTLSTLDSITVQSDGINNYIII